MTDVSDGVLGLFSAPVADWFRATFGQPTPPQAQGWPVIARGEHALIVSPTGSGKTLTAFLWAIDRLRRELGAGDADPGTRVVYVSPLKALSNDVERNLQVPLRGIARPAAVPRDHGSVDGRSARDPADSAKRHRHPAESGPDASPSRLDIRVALRTGDTPANERQKMARKPPHILVTTPESLYLLLTSERARGMFATAETVIVDEIHTLIGSKRGAHLALTLERLERLTDRPLQRVGLSATVRPLENAARFLGGQSAGSLERPVTIVDAAYRKPLDLRVVTAVDDFVGMPGASVWPSILPVVTDLIEGHRTTLVFCNNRRLAERTADRLNEQRLVDRGIEPPRPESSVRGSTGMFGLGANIQALEEHGLPPIRAHHGSMSREARLQMEAQLKAGQLPALVATSSLELGIDVGEIDLVVHLQSPKSVSAGLQRVGRSGHLVGQTSKGRVFPTFADDLVEAAAVAHGMLRGEIEATHTPENPLDVLAQQVMAMVALEEWRYDDLYALVRSAYPYRGLSPAAFRSVIEMLAGKYPARVSRNLPARLHWDRVNDRLAALPGSRILAIRSGGTIPDRGAYALVTGDRRTRVGELDEEFVFETRKGDVFVLGAQTWRVLEIDQDRVIAEPAPGEVPRMPFWRGDYPWRPYDLGKRIGAFRRHLVDLIRPLTRDDLTRLRRMTEAELAALPEPVGPLTELVRFLRDECALDRNSIVLLIEHLHGQLEHVGQVATDRTIVVELYEDALGEPRMVVHSPFGGRVNGPWGIALAGAIREKLGVEAQINTGDDGILVRFSGAETEPPADLVPRLTSGEARERLVNDLPGSAVFGAQFRMNAARALILPRSSNGKRTPLWLARLRAKDLQQSVAGYGDFPIVLETYRDCLRDVMDLDGLTEVLDGIAAGDLQVVVHESEFPSPLAAALDYRFAMQYVYEYDAPRGERALAALSVDRGLLADLLQDGSLADLLKPEAVAEVAARVSHTGGDARARSAEELAQLLYELGDLSTVEVAQRSLDRGPDGDARPAPAYDDWIAKLAGQGRIVEREVGGQRRWVHAERLAEYEQVTTDPRPLLRRWLQHAGPTAERDLARRYGLDEARVAELLAGLGPEVVVGAFEPGGERRWVDRRNLEQMHRRTLALLRREVRPVPLAAYAAFLRDWQQVRSGASAEETGNGQPDLTSSGLSRSEGPSLNQVLQQLRGLAVPGQAWERDVLPIRVADFDPDGLAELCQSGELLWAAEGGKDPRRARVGFFFRGEGQLFLDREPPADALAELSESARDVYELLRSEGAALLPDILDTTGLTRSAAQAALVELALAGLVANDTLGALHALLGYELPPSLRPARLQSSLEAQLAALLPRDRQRPLTRHRMREARRHAGEVVRRAVRSSVSQGWAGRWSLVHRIGLLGRALPEEELWSRRARQLLVRWGVVSRACLEREADVFSWDGLYPVLARLEMRGEVRRGYFVDGLPGPQFALPETVDRLRAVNAARDGAEPTVLSAVDPAQLFGTEEWGGRLRFARVASTAVAAQAGEPVAVMEDAGANVLAAADHPALVSSLRALGRWWSTRADGRLKVERWHGAPVLDSSGTPFLEAAGFVRDYGGMLWIG
ncbi:MAG TPA: DEAD/DEAH box helicase [Chloroflexota bacterium]